MSLKVIAIRVQDIERQIWYNWDRGAWSAPPVVKNKFYVAYAIESVSAGTTTNVSLRLRNLADGLLIGFKGGLTVPPYGTEGLEYWSGSLQAQSAMQPLSLRCEVRTGSVETDRVTFTIDPLNVAPPPEPEPTPEPNGNGGRPCLLTALAFPAFALQYIRIHIRPILPPRVTKFYYDASARILL